jgi:hypothetical protein
MTISNLHIAASATKRENHQIAGGRPFMTTGVDRANQCLRGAYALASLLQAGASDAASANSGLANSELIAEAFGGLAILTAEAHLALTEL